MRPRRLLPPELYCPGTNPSQAATCRPHLNLGAVADGGAQGGGADLAQAAQALQLGTAAVLARHGADQSVVLGNALVQVVDLTEQIADHPVRVSGQLLEQQGGLAAHGVGLGRQDVAELGEQSADAVKETLIKSRMTSAS